jgi:hypothetical protein
MDASALLLAFLPMLSVGAGYLLKKEVDRKYILELEAEKHRLQRVIEAEKNRQQIKFKAELIAELLSLWISYPEDLTKLNQLSYQAFLWLPDDIALDLSNLLARADDAKSVPAIVAEVRKHLLGDTSVSAEHVITFMIGNTGYTYNLFKPEIIPAREKKGNNPDS